MTNKYNAKKCFYNGMTFDSIKEARRYSELRLLEMSGEISGLSTQVEFEIIPKQKGERRSVYTADFVYTITATGEKVVEDVKSYITRKKPDYVLRRKLMLLVHGIKIKEV